MSAPTTIAAKENLPRTKTTLCLCLLPDILDHAERSSEKSLCPRELHPLCGDDACNINQAYSSSNVSGVTASGQQGVSLSPVTSQRELSVSCASVSSDGADRDSGCFTAVPDTDLAGVRSLFATLDRTAVRHHSPTGNSGACKSASCQDTDMYSYMTADDACEKQQCSDTVNEHTLPQRDLQVHGDVMDVTQVPCCRRSADPHMHSRV